MKKAIVFLTAVVFALTFGLAYADDSMTKTEDMSGEILSNGVTIFATGPAVYDAGPIVSEPVLLGGASPCAEGLGAGGPIAEGSSLDLGNSVTIFASGPIAFDVGPQPSAGAFCAAGSGAGGLGSEESGVDLNNGITVYHIGPAMFDN